MAIFPQRDESRALSRFPIMIVLIIVANVAVFLVELALGDDFIQRYSMKPAEIVRGRQLETLFTSMFMHANFLHIFGNMLYLWVFGDELEANYLGPFRFGVFSLLCGLAADAAQIVSPPRRRCRTSAQAARLRGCSWGSFWYSRPTASWSTFSRSGTFASRLSS